MIAHIHGRVTALTPHSAVLDVAGVGMLLHCTPRTLSTLHTGETAHLYTSLSVREDSLTLYGFSHDTERDLFEVLQTASGVGPKLALTALNTYSADRLHAIITSSDINALTQVSGIGKKGAQKIILELKDRIPHVVSEEFSTTATPHTAVHDHVIAGLRSLGWSQQEAEDATQRAASEEKSDDVSQILKRAIGVLGGQS